MSQTRIMSSVESAANVAIGYGVAVATQAIVFPMFGISIRTRDHFGMAAIFTVVSLVRSYFIRRLFNKIK